MLIQGTFLSLVASLVLGAGTAGMAADARPVSQHRSVAVSAAKTVVTGQCVGGGRLRVTVTPSAAGFRLVAVAHNIPDRSAWKVTLLSQSAAHPHADDSRTRQPAVSAGSWTAAANLRAFTEPVLGVVAFNDEGVNCTSFVSLTWPRGTTTTCHASRTLVVHATRRPDDKIAVVVKTDGVRAGSTWTVTTSVKHTGSHSSSVQTREEDAVAGPRGHLYSRSVFSRVVQPGVSVLLTGPRGQQCLSSVTTTARKAWPPGA